LSLPRRKKQIGLEPIGTHVLGGEELANRDT
jgi:hypothetical protein